MERLLVQLGKAWSVFRRDGIVNGSRRVVSSIPTLFRRADSGDVLFIASGVGDSARYRCAHVAESLRLQGFRAGVIQQDTLRLSRFAEKFSVFVFHRTSWTSSVEAFIRQLESLKKTVIFDTDDLTFDVALFKQTAAYEAMNAFERKQYQNGIGAEFLKSSAVSGVTTSTEFLAERLRVFGKPVFVVPNRLSREDVTIAEAILETRKKDTEELRMRDVELRMRNKESDSVVSSSISHLPFPAPVTIGYFSGSTGHDRDFATVSSVLKRLLDEFEYLRIFIGGPLNLPGVLEPYTTRIDHVSYVPRAENFRNIASVDINIAPLEIGNPFCEAKSELKFFEAGIVGISTIATATQTFQEAIRDGEDGYIAVNEEDWYKKASQLISDGDFRRKMGERARETALRRYTTNSDPDGEYSLFLKARIPHS